MKMPIYFLQSVKIVTNLEYQNYMLTVDGTWIFTSKYEPQRRVDGCAKTKLGLPSQTQKAQEKPYKS